MHDSKLFFGELQSLMNLCGWESLSNIRGDYYCPHFVAKGTWARCATSLPTRKVSEESLGGDETEALCKTSHEQCIITNSCQLNCFNKTSVGQPFINCPQICTIFITAKNNVPSVINQD